MFFCSLHFSSFLSALSSKWLVGGSRARKSHLNLLKSCDSFGENHGDGNFLFSFARLFEIRNIILSFRCSWLVDWGDFSAACFFQCYHFNRKFSNELDRQEKQKIFFLFGGYIHVLNAVHAKRENTDTNERSRHKKKTRVVQRGTLWVVMNKLKASLELKTVNPPERHSIASSVSNCVHSHMPTSCCWFVFPKKKKIFSLRGFFSIGRRSHEGRMEKMPVNLFSLTIRFLSKGSPLHSCALSWGWKKGCSVGFLPFLQRISRPWCKTNESN